jgi:hypothetical protein
VAVVILDRIRGLMWCVGCMGREGYRLNDCRWVGGFYLYFVRCDGSGGIFFAWSGRGVSG